MSARTPVRPHGRECFTPGNFKKDATVRRSHGCPRGHRPSICYRPRDNHVGHGLGYGRDPEILTFPILNIFLVFHRFSIAVLVFHIVHMYFFET
jgi:hypothetical protein